MKLAITQRIALLTQILDEEHGIDVDNWTNSYLGMVTDTLMELCKLRGIPIE